MKSDIVIVGGGLCGLSLACALRDSPLQVSVIEARGFDMLAKLNQDGRSLVLSYGSSQILQKLGMWPTLASKATDIQTIHISKRGAFLKAHLSAQQEGIPALGYVVPMPHLLQTLYAAVKDSPNIQLLDNTRVNNIAYDGDGLQLNCDKNNKTEVLQAQLCVAADGAQSFVRSTMGIHVSIKDYQQVACVTKVHIEKPHQHRAIERFTDAGPLALLPLCDQRCGVVWMHHPDNIDNILNLSDEDFIARLHQYFGYGFGRFSKISPRASYPLKLIRADKITADKMVLVGNAANTLHPVAGQGFNLGLRDIAVLAQLLQECPQGCGDNTLLSRYTQARMADHQHTVRFTDTLATWFTSSKKRLIGARNIALLNVILGTPFKKLLLKQALRSR